MPTADSNYQGVRYVLDHYANTQPTQATGTFIPTTQQKLQLSNLDDGIWVLHMVTVDRQGYQTKAIAHYQAWIATTTPTNGTANGQISWINMRHRADHRRRHASPSTADCSPPLPPPATGNTTSPTSRPAPGRRRRRRRASTSGDQDRDRHRQHGHHDRFPADEDVVRFGAWLPLRTRTPPSPICSPAPTRPRRSWPRTSTRSTAPSACASRAR